jgi:hypothetical protein
MTDQEKDCRIFMAMLRARQDRAPSALKKKRETKGIMIDIFLVGLVHFTLAVFHLTIPFSLGESSSDPGILRTLVTNALVTFFVDDILIQLVFILHSSFFTHLNLSFISKKDTGAPSTPTNPNSNDENGIFSQALARSPILSY